MSEHTELPLEIRRWNKDDPEGWPIDRTSIVDADNKALFINARFAENVKEHAEFIVKACNNHDQLLDALKELLRCDERPPTEVNIDLVIEAMQKAREVIKQAEQ